MDLDTPSPLEKKLQGEKESGDGSERGSEGKERGVRRMTLEQLKLSLNDVCASADMKEEEWRKKRAGEVKGGCRKESLSSGI